MIGLAVFIVLFLFAIGAFERDTPISRGPSHWK